MLISGMESVLLLSLLWLAMHLHLCGACTWRPIAAPGREMHGMQLQSHGCS